MMLVYDKIRKIRLEKKLSQMEVAEKIGLSQNGYQKKEAGESEFNATELLKLSQIFEKPVEEFFNESVIINGMQSYNDVAHQNNNYGDFTHERKVWEELVATQKEFVATQKEMLQRQSQELEQVKAENAALKQEITRLSRS